jgi:hypothetical protein
MFFYDPVVLAAVGDGYADAIKGAPGAGMYVDLADLTRYEVRTPIDDPALYTAAARLELRERLHEEAAFPSLPSTARVSPCPVR